MSKSPKNAADFKEQNRTETTTMNPDIEALKPLFSTKELKKSDFVAHDVIMVGAGPASLAAAIYTTREDIETVIYEKAVIGGLSAITDWIDNYPGFPSGVSGMELAENFQKQAERFGAKIELGEVVSILKKDKLIEVNTVEGKQYAKAVLIASGSDYKKIDIKGEKEYYARGVHYCATCDGAFYRGKKLVVVGGGNSAVQEAIFLTRFASHIDLLVRSTIKASDILIHQLENNPKISIHLGVSPKEIIGDGKFVNKVQATDKNNKNIEYNVDGVFVFVGLIPNTGFVNNPTMEYDEKGLIITDENLMTSVEGVFAAGDVRSGATMQIASAVGEGATAAMRIREYLVSTSPNSRHLV
jgi:thioredoxin reductase (NADPH)